MDHRAAPRRLSCAGVGIAALDPAAAAKWVIDSARELAGPHEIGVAGSTESHLVGRDVHLCNTFTLALADQDDDYRALLNSAALNLADGTPVMLANRLFHQGAPKERVRGPSLFVDVLRAGCQEGVKHFLLGSTDATLTQLRQRIEQRISDVQIVGAIAPPFRSLTEREIKDIDTAIVTSGAQIVWVGLGTPKQDWEVARLATTLPVVAVAVGAAFDFVAGTVAEAPLWMQRTGTEWIHRLGSEPKRLWKRYLIGGPRFAAAVVRRRGQG
jgi:N-acetylglucosaminyldiphosphoundecaprenol N-acetyl-beta-D-mannosaminyltransferase